MTDTMIEKVAAKLYDADVEWSHGGSGVFLDVALPPWSKARPRTRQRFITSARAALLAIREPDDATRQRASEIYTSGRGSSAHAAMIDAILDGRA